MFVSHNADELFRSNMIENPTILYNRCKFKNFSKKKKQKKKKEEKMAFQVGRSFYMS